MFTMDIKKQKVLLFASVCVIAMYIGYSFVGMDRLIGVFKQDNYYMGVPTISQEEVIQLTQGKEKTRLEEGLFFSYNKVPLDVEEQTVYISQSMVKTEWEGFFELEQSYEKAGYNLYFLEDDFLDDKEEAIKQGHKFSLYVIGEDYYQLNIVFSGLGVMSISKIYEYPKEIVDYWDDPDQYIFENQIEYLGEVTVLAADIESSYQMIQGYVKYHLKGSASIDFPKKSYAITFVDAGGKDVAVPILGMESNAKWKLNSLYTDNTLLREKSACDIWQIIDADNTLADNGSFDAEYIELIIDNEYVGVYLLVEPVNGQTLELNKNDILYKCVNWNVAKQQNIEESIANGWRVQLPFRIKYPKVITDYQVVWSPIKDFSNVFWTDGDKGELALEQRIHVSNVIDVDIFLEICALDDNNYKNIYYAAHENGDGTYIMTLHPWDFDLSFGHRYVHDTMEAYEFYTDPVYNCDLSLLDKVIDENPQIAVTLYNTYMRYRQTILSDKNIEEIIRTNWEHLERSGAYLRNLQMWKTEHGDTTIDSVLQFTKDRLMYTDSVYQEQYGEQVLDK